MSGYVYDGQGYLIPVGMVAGDAEGFVEAVNSALDLTCDSIDEIEDAVPQIDYVSVNNLSSATMDGEDFTDAYGVFVGRSDGADATADVVNTIFGECGVENSNGYFGHFHVECEQ